MDTVLSVIVPVYNCREYLNKCIDSLLEAKTENTEIILVNDGSTDSSGDICDEYALKNPCVSVIHQQNSGVTSARKNGLLKSSGKYITYVDSDDWVDTEIYKQMLEKAEKYNADIVICDIVKETELGLVFLPNFPKEGLYEKEKLEKEIYSVMLFDFSKCIPGIYPSLCNKIIKRELLEKVISDVDNTIVFGEDALCSYPAMIDADRIYVHKGFLYHYRENVGSLTNIYDKNILKKFLVLHDEFCRQFEKRNFGGGNQLRGYIAKYSIDCIRKEMILNRDVPLKARMAKVREYIRDERICSAFRELADRCSDRKTKVKLFLAYKNRLFLLYLFFQIKETILKLKGKKSE